jgi:hypothetical protein
VKIYVEIEADGAAINEVSAIITRAIQVKGVQRFLLSDNIKIQKEEPPNAEENEL